MTNFSLSLISFSGNTSAETHPPSSSEQKPDIGPFYSNITYNSPTLGHLNSKSLITSNIWISMLTVQEYIPSGLFLNESLLDVPENGKVPLGRPLTTILSRETFFHTVTESETWIGRESVFFKPPGLSKWKEMWFQNRVSEIKNWKGDDPYRKGGKL